MITSWEQIYRQCLRQALGSICFEKNGSQHFSFEELFYPLAIEEGRFAFQNYAEQKDMAQQLHQQRESDPQKKRDLYSRLSAMSLLLQERKHPTAASGSRSSTAHLLYDTRSLRRQYSFSTSLSRKRAQKLTAKRSDTRFTSSAPLPEAMAPSSPSHKSPPNSLFDKAAIRTDPAFSLPDVLRETVGTALEEENTCDHSSLMVSNNRQESRVLVMASAGHGKTTLLKRVALWYCHKGKATPEHLSFQEKYALEGSYLPCLIYLRDRTERTFSLQNIIHSTMKEVLKTAPNYRAAVSRQQQTPDEWITSVQGQLILLIDGLDELSDSLRHDFLAALEDYLTICPATPVLMTSRPVGLSEERIIDRLLSMRFRGRSIIPLTDEMAAQYSFLWIEKTQPEEQHDRLKDSVKQILTQNKFYYLREFLRTPLELFLLLRQVAGGRLSLNRFQMFHDTLWEYFTSHVAQYSEKQFIFEDTMTFLGFLAYRMQIKDSLYLPLRDLEELTDDLKALSFHTDYIGGGHADYCRVLLDNLASSVGIIERDLRYEEVVYTFPIRAYQEFLTAHACCHLCLTPYAYAPQPYEILQSRLNDSRWAEVISFALYDMDANHSPDFDRLIGSAFETLNDLEQLRSIVEGDLFVSRDNASLLCRQVFHPRWLNHEQRDFLSVCMGTSSASSYVFALHAAYRAGGNDNICLEADALAMVLWECSVQHAPWERAAAYLKEKDNALLVRLGAMMVVEMTKAMLGETLPACADFIRKTFHLTDSLLTSLSQGAVRWNELLCVSALTNLWLLPETDSSTVAAYLNEQTLAVVLHEMEQQRPLFRHLLLTRAQDTRDPLFKTALQMVYTLGTFPLRPDQTPPPYGRIRDPFVIGYCRFLYHRFQKKKNFDEIALAKALIYGDETWEQFLLVWAGELCGGMPSRLVRKYLSRPRNQQHFSLTRASLSDEESDCLNTYKAGLPLLTDDSQVFALFERGKIGEAADCCIRTMYRQTGSTPGNLAFLLRFGHLQRNDPVTGQPYDIPTLLLPQIVCREPYALINLALYELEQHHDAFAETLLQAITPQGWHEIVSDFWYPVLCQKLHHPEGTLVCDLAKQYTRKQ